MKGQIPEEVAAGGEHWLVGLLLAGLAIVDGEGVLEALFQLHPTI